jgi:hypothetical protein
MTSGAREPSERAANSKKKGEASDKERETNALLSVVVG